MTGFARPAPEGFVSVGPNRGRGGFLHRRRAAGPAGGGERGHRGRRCLSCWQGRQSQDISPTTSNRFNRSALDIGAEILVVSQFTLYGDTRKGRRPDFTDAAGPEEARRLYEHTVDLFRELGLTTATGRFQEYMEVNLANDGPVTLMLDSADRQRPRR